MLTALDLVNAMPPWHLSSTLASTGFNELDAITGGLRSGQVWLVIGGPGQGRTTLLHQWAVSAALSGNPVAVVAQKSSAGQMAARFLATAGTIPLNTFQRGGRPDPNRLGRARERLGSANMTVWPAGETFVPELWDPSAEATTLLALDDGDRLGGVSPDRLASWAGEGATVVASLPRADVVLNEHEEPDLDRRWATCADVILEIRHRGLPDWPFRPGDARIDVLKNRHGPCRSLNIGFHGHYARFVDQATGAQG